jgi:hypothetical protein
VECESVSGTGNNRGDWNHFKITQTIPEQHTGKSTKLRNYEKTTILGTGHILLEVPIYKYKIYFTGEITLHVAQIVNTEQLQHCMP